MEYRQLGSSGLRVSALTLGTMTFGGRDNFANVGSTDVAGATRQIDLCLDRGVNFIDTADVYSGGLSEEIVGEALKGRRDKVLLATKARMPMGDGPNDAGLSRHHLIAACEASLRRLGTDYIDLYQVHEWDGQTPLDETMEALDTLVRDGKVRYVGGSNYGGRQLMKALAVADRHGYRALRHAADLLLAPVPRRRVRARADRDRRGRRDHRLEPARGRPAVGQVPAWRRAPGRLAPADRLERAAGPRPGAALRRRRGAGRDRRGPRRVGRAGRARLADRPPRRGVADRRRADRRAARRQPRGGRPEAVRRRARAARGAQPAAADLSLLAPGQDGLGPARTRGPRAAAARISRTRRGRAGRPRPRTASACGPSRPGCRRGRRSASPPPARSAAGARSSTRGGRRRRSGCAG